MITLEEARKAMDGRWLSCSLPPETPLRGAAFDTRHLGEAEIFFALAGASGNGHDHLAQLADTKVKLAVVGRGAQVPGYHGALLHVADPMAALARAAAFVVAKHRPLVVAVTGSYGKTTAKEMIAHVLEGGRKVLKTPGSYNNEIGVPMALLALDGTQDTVVLEFAARHEGDIDRLGAIAPPDVAVLLNVGHAHIGVFGSREAIYRAKGEIFNHLRPDGMALVNSEDPRLAELAGKHRITTFGRKRGNFRVERLKIDARGKQYFTGRHGKAQVEFSAPFSGAHAFYPILAAWAVAHEAGLDDATIARRIAEAPGEKGRSRLLAAPGGATVLDDTYNASPETVVGLVTTMATLEEQEKVLVLGHLSELEKGLADSLRIIALQLTPPLTEVWVHDPARPKTAAQLRKLAPGFPVRDFESLPELIDALRSTDRPGVALGIKGSRSAHMERALEGLMGREVQCPRELCPLLIQCAECPELEADPTPEPP